MSESDSRLRFEIYHTAFKLCFGGKEDRDAAISRLLYLVQLLREGLTKDTQ